MFSIDAFVLIYIYIYVCVCVFCVVYSAKGDFLYVVQSATLSEYIF